MRVTASAPARKTTKVTHSHRLIFVNRLIAISSPLPSPSVGVRWPRRDGFAPKARRDGMAPSMPPARTSAHALHHQSMHPDRDRGVGIEGVSRKDSRGEHGLVDAPAAAAA